MYSIVIPAYNEEERIETTLKDYLQHFSRLKVEFEIIVVCDGNDRTASAVRKFKTKNIKLMEFHSRLGKGGAILEGFKKSKGEVIGFIDADGSVSAKDFHKIIDFVTLGYDAVIGSRKMKGSIIIKKYSFKRQLFSLFFNIFSKMLFNLHVKDINCGAKAFKGDVIKSLIPQIHHTWINQDLEILWKLKKNNYTVKEVPITWTYKEGSKILNKMSLSIFISILKIRLGSRSPK
jgi:glycosyltransferase involved in cell wall biosynthesis